MGIAAKNYQNREDDAVHGMPLGPGGQWLCPISGDLWSAVARAGQELTFFVGHQCGAQGDTGDDGGVRGSGTSTTSTAYHHRGVCSSQSLSPQVAAALSWSCVDGTLGGKE